MGLEVKRTLSLVLGWIFLTSSFVGRAQELSKKEIVLIQEAFNVHKEIGETIWPSWNSSDAPLLFVSGKYQYLLNHPNPPVEYQLSKKEFHNSQVYIAESQYQESTQAVLPINGIPTMVMTAPTDDSTILLWIMKFQHELFHIYQQENTHDAMTMKLEFRNGEYEGSNELNFPFQYDSDTLMALIHEEGKTVYELLVSDSVGNGFNQLAEIYKTYSQVVYDSSHLRYKNAMEWKEGVARYTEYKFAILVSDSTQYKPLREFAELYNFHSYSAVTQYYNERSLINPIKFVGKGVKGIVLFYYLGLGKALILDKCHLSWKDKYLNLTLDDLIINSR